MAYKRNLTEAHKRKISEGVKRAWAKVPQITTLEGVDGELSSPSTPNNNVPNNINQNFLSDGEKNHK